MNRISNRNRYSQQSNARGIDTNKKFIPFFTQLPLKDKADYRIAYFIAHLREEVNRHKGINRPYKPTRHEIIPYDLIKLPVLESVLREIHAKTGKHFRINIKKNYEIGYTGNIRFLSLPAAMSPGTALYDEWVAFFCQLFEYLNSMKISSDCLNFIKTLKQNEPDLYEYRFAVAVVQTFLKDLSTSTGDDILMMPDKWNTASSGTFITKNEMVIKLFSPGKIFNEKRIITSSSGTAPVKRKYYNIQKGGYTKEVAKLIPDLVEAFTDLQPLLVNFANGLLYKDAQKDTLTIDAGDPNAKTKYREAVDNDDRVENSYDLLITTIKIIAEIITKPAFPLNLILKNPLVSAEIVDAVTIIHERLTNFMPDFKTYQEQNKKDKVDHVPGELNLYSTMIEAVIYLNTHNPDIINSLTNAASAPIDPDADDEAAAEALAKQKEAEAAEAAAAAIKAKTEADEEAIKAKAEAAAKAAEDAVKAKDAVDSSGAGSGDGGGGGESIAALSSKISSGIPTVQKKLEEALQRKSVLEVNISNMSDKQKQEIKELNEIIKTTEETVKKLVTAGSKFDAINTMFGELAKDVQKRIQPELALLHIEYDKGSKNTAVINTAVIEGLLTIIQNKINGSLTGVSPSGTITYTDVNDDDNILEIESLSVNDMYNRLIVCGATNPYVTDPVTQFDTDDIEDFYQKRMKKLYTEADTDLKALVAKVDPLDPKDPSASIANIFKSHGLKVSDNKYKYERNKGQLIITDLTTGKTVDSYVPLKKDADTCKSMGITFNTAEQCYTFLNECILGENPEKCKSYLYNKDFWTTTVDDFRHHSNFYTIYITLKKYEFKINTSGILNVIEDVDEWVKSQAPSPSGNKIPQELLALLKVAVEEINKHPAILNVGFKGSVKPDTKQSRYAGDLIIALKLQEKTRSKLPSKYLREGSLDETGIIISSDKITQAVNTRADKMETLLRTELEEIKTELDLLKAPLKSGSERTKYFHHQRGGEPPDYDLHKYEHYNRLHTLKNHMKNIDTGMSSTLMESFTKYIYALEVKDIKLHSANQERIKNEIAKIRNLEIFLMRTAFYVYKFIFFFSEFKTYLPLIDPGSKMYAEYVGNVEIDLKRLEELVDSTHGKLDQYCKNTNDGAAKPGKVQALATICSQLEELVWPKVPERSRM
jgi:hypothetical protein